MFIRIKYYQISGTADRLAMCKIELEARVKVIEDEEADRVNI